MTQYSILASCFDIDKLEAWIKANTIVHNEGTDQEEHIWAPGARKAIKMLCNNLEATGIADIVQTTKQCVRCKETKSTSMFSRNLQRNDLLQVACKACNKAARKPKA